MKKVFIFLPDGVGLRNFAFNQFYELGQQEGLEITYLNKTNFPLKDSFGYDEVLVKQARSNSFTDLFKRARKEIELKQNYKNFKDKAYLSYHFPYKFKDIKSSLKNSFVILLSILFNSKKGLAFIRKTINNLERKSAYYQDTKKQLATNKPDFIFSTNQRPLTAIAPLLAAKDLQIPTATFIFSWDNLPKGMMVVETDYYFVWSEYMKQELLAYYPFIKEEQISVVGTPQFDIHFKQENIQNKTDFYKEYDLDINTKYICYSGDDITTSPNDQYYLEDVANAVKKYNEEHNDSLGIIFRRCPVDFSNRYDEVLDKNKDIIKVINPLWKNVGNGWNNVMPTPQDSKLLATTIFYSEGVINLGSSMIFDAVSHKKPCAYVNYNTVKKASDTWNVEKIYKYIHFKSMPNKDTVVWINYENEIYTALQELLTNAKKYTRNAQKWMDKINNPPHDNGASTIWKEISAKIKR